MKKIKNVKLKKLEPKSQIDIAEAISDVLNRYKQYDEPGSIKDVITNIDIDFKNIFKNYKQFEYHGFTTQLGMVTDIVIHYKNK